MIDSEGDRSSDDRVHGLVDGVVGDVVGQVGDTEVRTPFGGQVVGWLAAAGERVQDGQPLVWMRIPDRT